MNHSEEVLKELARILSAGKAFHLSIQLFFFFKIIRFSSTVPESNLSVSAGREGSEPVGSPVLNLMVFATAVVKNRFQIQIQLCGYMAEEAK